MDKNILDIINNEAYEELQLLFSHMNAVDIADVLEQAEEGKAIAAFRLLPPDEDLATEVFSYISPGRQQLFVQKLSAEEVEDILEDLSVDDIVDFIDEVPEEISKYVLESVSPEKGEMVDRILDYPEDSAGRLMNTEFIELSPEVTAQDALHTIRTSGVDKENIYTCYVVDEARGLVGVVTADVILYAPLNAKIGEIMDTNVISAQVADDREEIANTFSKYDLLALPVVNRRGQLMGIVTVDDILRIIHHEDTEDFEQMAGIINPSDEPYLRTGVVTHAKNRILWLLVLMLTAAITGAIISTFEDALAVLPILAVFIPMLMGAGGNAGAQSSTVVIRGMALGEIKTSDTLRLVWRETRIALVCSLILGVANFARIAIMYDRDFHLAWVVTLSLAATLIVAKIIGCTLPIAAKKLKLDPSLMAAPLLTTIVDCTALIVFFAVARVVFTL
ncbi:MAG: magnesium transporter [Defluviitaleaceae bacterium]|nr:magnesium transporter [Defluviitaleaceae bacterium]